MIYWESDGTDDSRKWNPTTLGGSDGVQLALVKDGTVERLPTKGVCENCSSTQWSKEWYNLGNIGNIGYQYKRI